MVSSYTLLYKSVNQEGYFILSCTAVCVIGLPGDITEYGMNY